VRLLIDGSGCVGHGRCYRIAPDLLTYDEEGYAAIRDELIEVPDDLVESAKDAAGTCPEEAISLISE
jgi:ferredoxin